MALLVLSSLLGSGCVGVQLVLKSPVESKCNDTGLKACADLTDGILLYVDGKKEEGRAKLTTGVAANSPEDLLAFGEKLQFVLSLPGMDSYTHELKEVVDFLVTSAKAKKPTKVAKAKTPPAKPKAPSKADTDGASTDDADPDGFGSGPPAASSEATAKARTPPRSASVSRQLRTATTIPAGNPKASPCKALKKLGTGSMQGLCVAAAEGPLVVTDIHFGVGCPNEMFVLVGDAEQPRWFLLNPAMTPLDFHGASLVVKADEALVFGVRDREGSFRENPTCSITWAARDPASDEVLR